jgi:hypothetical protein
LKRGKKPGTVAVIFKIFSPKIRRKNWRILTQNKAKLGKNLIITVVFDKNANFFAEIAENFGHNIDPQFPPAAIVY